MVAGEIEPITGKSPLAGVLPIFEAAAGNETWSLFDLRPLRPRGASLSAGTPEFQRLLHGFDFVLIIPLGTPSREL
jgi:hypothetical protein